MPQAIAVHLNVHTHLEHAVLLGLYGCLQRVVGVPQARLVGGRRCIQRLHLPE